MLVVFEYGHRSASGIGLGILVICLEQYFDYFIHVFQYSTYDLSSYRKLI